MRLTVAGLWLAAIGMPAAAQPLPATPLFSDNSVLPMTLSGPFSDLIRNAPRDNRPLNGTLTIGGAQAVPVRLSARGITRRRHDICAFPPLRVDLGAAAPAGALLAGQRRLKLVTHCQGSKDFQRYLLLEYTAYRLYNVLTPASFRVRLASIAYTSESGKPIITRLGFFIEDSDDLADRIGLKEAKLPSRIAVGTLRRPDAARMAVFEYLISNLDWAMNGGPPGEECCHNARLFGAPGATRDIVPVPYDFDYSGLVDAPYAVAPKELRVSNVRQRRYHGYCSYNGEALVAAAEIRSKRAELIAVIGQIPELDAGSRRQAVNYLDGFFRAAATDDDVGQNLLKDCVR